MHKVDPRFWPWALGGYPAWGFILGLGWVEAIAHRLVGRAGIGTFFAVNLFMPLGAILITAAYPRLRTALPGAVLLTLGWIGARMFYSEPRPWEWDAHLLASRTHPILIAATAAYALIVAMTVGVTGIGRQVGTEPDGPVCAACGYSLKGLPGGRCPECGADATGSCGG